MAPANSYVSKEDIKKKQKEYPLKILVCETCWLVQTEDFADKKEFFSNTYAYFSSTSQSWLNHAKEYVDKIIKLENLSKQSFVIEIASNDGYLLKNFLEVNIPCLGIEPTKSTADAAEKIGIPVLREFFDKQLGLKLALDQKKADLIIGNNVYAHVPDINDFTMGLKEILKTNGTITLEFPHLMNLIEHTQFDTIYHEHFSYLSLYTVCKIFEKESLRIFDVEKLKTHGGSLRVYGCHFDDIRKTKNSVALLLQKEKLSGLQKIETYKGFQIVVEKIKSDLIKFLTEQKKKGKKVVAYGAAAKGNTLLNYAGINEELLPAVFDAATSKQGCFLPGSHIPILSPQYIIQTKADYVLILPWNIAEEIIIENSILKKNGVQFVIAVPELKIL
jgi:SAM-dependent methyltransferase